MNFTLFAEVSMNLEFRPDPNRGNSRIDVTACSLTSGSISMCSHRSQTQFLTPAFTLKCKLGDGAFNNGIHCEAISCDQQPTGLRK